MRLLLDAVGAAREVVVAVGVVAAVAWLTYVARLCLAVGYRFLTVGFKVRCSACDGTGICELGGDDAEPHACCNFECEKSDAWVRTRDGDRVRSVVGRGYVMGGLVSRLLYGGPREILGYSPDYHLHHRTTVSKIQCLHADKEGREHV